MFAVRLDAEGSLDLDNGKSIAWSDPRSGAYMQTPILVGEFLYTCADSGVVKCYRAATGEVVYRERLGDGRTGFTASAAASGGHIYYTSEVGDVYVVRAGPKLEVLSINPLGETCMATPAITDGVLYFRARSHLIAIGR